MGYSSAREVPFENQGPVSDPGSESGGPEIGSPDPQAMREKPEADVLETLTIASEVLTDGEKPNVGKKRAKTQWPLSQYSQGQLLTLVEYLMLLYRSLLPTLVWYCFFLNKDYGSLFSSLMTGLYLTFKLTSVVEKLADGKVFVT
ncbi:unnamed protein product [Eruca vesicaria subsp. sativa]|uniref:Uncharacterized protein n=1 Tax=Eruca vesicaria subsp. sativa TaxID=29727 RepID=A0ABC8IXA1_ERUVS|nr:unnamed protein product [Eruca vesicaria subsp. sativa]